MSESKKSVLQRLSSRCALAKRQWVLQCVPSWACWACVACIWMNERNPFFRVTGRAIQLSLHGLAAKQGWLAWEPKHSLQREVAVLANHQALCVTCTEVQLPLDGLAAKQAHFPWEPKAFITKRGRCTCRAPSFVCDLQSSSIASWRLGSKAIMSRRIRCLTGKTPVRVFMSASKKSIFKLLSSRWVSAIHQLLCLTYRAVQLPLDGLAAKQSWAEESAAWHVGSSTASYLRRSSPSSAPEGQRCHRPVCLYLQLAPCIKVTSEALEGQRRYRAVCLQLWLASFLK